MNLRQLETYLWVAKLGSFSRTAEKLFTTQPAISSRIASLENELHVTLFERDAGSFRLTASGRSLLPMAEEALGAVAEMRERAGAPAEVSGLLRLGVSETIVQSWLPELLAQLRAIYPALDVEISIDVTANLRNELVDHALDLAFLMGPVSEYTVTNVTLCDFPLIWAMRPPIKGRKKIKMSLRDMLRFPILTFPRNTRPYSEINEVFRARTGSAPRIFPSSSLNAGQRMAERGVGIATVPAALVADALADGRLAEVETDWNPTPLKFTASYISDPARPIIGKVADLARKVADPTRYTAAYT